MLNNHGYLTAQLRREGVSTRFYVHRLVCAAFNGPPNVLHRQTAHLDGDKLNNRADNLKWVSPRENDTHKDSHGTRQSGERHPRARLTERDVLAIRASRRTRAQIAKDFGVSPLTVKDIRARVKWKCVGPAEEQGNAQPQPSISRRK